MACLDIKRIAYSYFGTRANPRSITFYFILFPGRQRYGWMTYVLYIVYRQNHSTSGVSLLQWSNEQLVQYACFVSKHLIGVCSNYICRSLFSSQRAATGFLKAKGQRCSLKKKTRQRTESTTLNKSQDLYGNEIKTF